MSGKLSCVWTDLVTEGNNLHEFLFASQKDKTSPNRVLGPVVQSIVITKYTDFFLLKKYEKLLHCNAKASHIFSKKKNNNKNNGVFQILTFEILTKR